MVEREEVVFMLFLFWTQNIDNLKLSRRGRANKSFAILDELVMRKYFLNI
jgi:hypothetical protein